MKILISLLKEWFEIKTKITKNIQNILFEEKEIWMYYCGQNVGTEISGKGFKFLRPILIFRKLSRDSFIGIPITSKLRTGNWWKKIIVRGKENNLVFAQIKNCDSKRLLYKIDRLSDVTFSETHKEFAKFIKNNPSK